MHQNISFSGLKNKKKQIILGEAETRLQNSNFKHLQKVNLRVRIQHWTDLLADVARQPRK